jgi:predicted dinucleotide-binding enzyme
MRIALIGYGKMGKAIERIAVAKGHEIILKIDLDNGFEMTRKFAEGRRAIEFTGPASATTTCWHAHRRAFGPLVVLLAGWNNLIQ